MTNQRNCITAVCVLFCLTLCTLLSCSSKNIPETDLTGTWSLITESSWTKYYCFDKDGICWIGGRTMGFMDDELFYIDTQPYTAGDRTVMLKDELISLVKMNDEVIPILHLQGETLKQYQQSLQIKGKIIQMKIDNKIWMLRQEENITCDTIKNAPRMKK